MADIYEKLLGLDSPATATTTAEDPYEVMLRRQLALPESYQSVDPTTAPLAAPYRPGAFPGAAPLPWNAPTEPPPQEEPTAPQPQGRNVVTDILRVPYAFGRNALTVLPGLPKDLGDLLGYGGTKAFNFVTGQNRPFEPIPVLPGQEDLNKGINRILGVSDEPPPGLAGAPERLAGILGSSVGPGAILGKIEPMIKLTGQTANVWNALKGALTSGTKGDIAIGAGSGIGQETVRQFFSDNPWLLAAGGALGGIATSMAHGGVTRMAKPYQEVQQVNKLGEITEGIERTGQDTLQSAATDVQTARDLAALEIKTARDTQRGVAAPLDADTSAKAAVLGTAAEDVEKATQDAAARTATAEAQQAQWIQAAEAADQQAAAARAAAAQPPPGAYEQLPQVLDLTNPPQGAMATGQAIKEQVAETGAAQAQAAAESRGPAYQAATKDLGTPDITRQGVIDLTKGDFTPKFQEQKKLRGENLDKIEAVITKHAKGKDAVPLDHLRNQLDKLVSEAIATPGVSVSSDILAWAEMGLTKAQKDSLKGEGLARAKAALQLNPEQAVPFTVLRKIDRDLGAEGRAGLVGTMQQGEARALKSALNKDFDQSFESPAGTGFSPEFDQYKKDWRDFRTNYDKSILGHPPDERAGHQAQDFISFLYGGNAKTNPQLAFIMAEASPETREAIKGHMLAHIAQRSEDAAGNLDPAALGKQIQKMRQNGTFELYFDDPAQRQALVDTWQNLSAKDMSIEPKLRAAIGKATPEEVPRLVFKPGSMSMTEKFQQISTPQQFQDAVAGWAADLKARYPDMSPDQLQTEVAALARKQDGVSQLDLMFAHIPGAADKISDMVTQHRVPPPPAPGKPTGPSRTMQQAISAGEAVVKQAQADNATQLKVVHDLHAQAQQAHKDALKLAKDAKAAGSTVTRETREHALEAVKETQRKQRQTQQDVATEIQTAKDRLKQAQKDARMTPEGTLKRNVATETMHGTFSAVALMSLVQGLTSRNNVQAAISATTLGLEGGRYAKEAFFRSARGQRFLEHYVPQQYGPKAATFASQILGQGASASANASPVPTMDEDEALVVPESVGMME